jgi:N-acetylmuramoyl-L-alanine amidase
MRGVIDMKKLFCVCLSLIFILNVGISCLAVENSDSSKIINIYYLNGNWEYEPVSLSVPIDEQNQYLYALKALVKGENIPDNCLAELPSSLEINDVKVEGNTIYVDFSSYFSKIIDEKKFAVDVVIDIFNYNIFKLNDFEEIRYTFDNSVNEAFKYNSVKREGYFKKNTIAPKKIIPENIKMNLEQQRNKFKTMTKEQIEEFLVEARLQKNSQQNVGEAIALAAYDPTVSIVVIDPGHGGTEPGATGTLSGTTYNEKDINLSIALALQTYLEDHGYTVMMTRTTDVTMGINARYLFANNNDADLFISVHNNSSTNSSVCGTTCLYPNNHDISESRDCAYWIHFFVADDVPEHRVPYIMESADPKGVLNYSTMPAIITETGFMSNSTDLAYLINQANRETIAEDIHLGVQFWDTYGEYWYY